jgi:hypothetical protein
MQTLSQLEQVAALRHETAHLRAAIHRAISRISDDLTDDSLPKRDALLESIRELSAAAEHEEEHREAGFACLESCVMAGWTVQCWKAAYGTGVWAAVLVAGSHPPDAVAEATVEHDDLRREIAEEFLHATPLLPIVCADTTSAALYALENRLRLLPSGSLQSGSSWADEVSDEYDYFLSQLEAGCDPSHLSSRALWRTQR